MNRTIRKQTQQLLTVLGLIVAPLLTLAAPASVSAAPVASISIASSASSVQQNSKVTMTVNVNTGGVVTDGVQAKVNYDATKFSYVNGSISYAGSPLNTDSPEFAVASGSIVFSRYTSTPPGPNGVFKLASFELTAIPNTGSGSISIDQAASTVGDHGDNGNNALGSVSGASITFTPIPAAVVVTPSAGGSTKPSTVATTKTNNAPSPDTTPVKVEAATALTPDPGPIAAAQPVQQKDSKPAVAAPKVEKSNKTLLYSGIATAALIVIGAGGFAGHKFALARKASGVAASEFDAPLAPVETTTPEMPHPQAGDEIKPRDQNLPFDDINNKQQ